MRLGFGTVFSKHIIQDEKKYFINRSFTCYKYNRCPKKSTYRLY
ncbi:DUF3173 family protein [Tenacibaculum larymnensis]|uniref:Uncharacterized protein n=1 Tax=Tenacibaculum larymnensis TaxID=2878201 RepID=A0A9X4EKX8_9FLAO|nr:hypothetical protein [Tenacibaculum larymnensis]